MPPPITMTLTKVIFQFLWGEQVELVRRTTLQQFAHFGGLAIPDPLTMNKSIKTTRVKMLKLIMFDIKLDRG